MRLRGFLAAVLAFACWGQQDARVAGALRSRYARREPAVVNTDQRIAHWEKQVKAAPSDVTALLGLASAFLQKMRETTDFSYVDRASGLVDRVLTSDASNYEALRLRIEVAMNYHRFPKAIAYAEELLERNPGDAGVAGLLGDAYMERGEYEKAGRAYQRMVELGGNLFSYNRLAWHRFVTGKTQEALVWMAQAVQSGSREPENEAWCLTEYGDLLFRTGRVDEAERAYQRALAAVPNYHRALAALGRLEASRHHMKEAIALFGKAQATVPFPEYAAALDALHRASGETAEADRQRKMVDAIAQIGKAMGEKANRTLAVIFADDERRIPDALALAQAEFEVRDDVYSQDTLAWVLLKAGKVPEAQAASEKALRFSTGEPVFYFHAGAIALAAGDKAKAQGFLERALVLNPEFDFRHAPEARRMLAGLKN